MEGTVATTEKPRLVVVKPTHKRVFGDKTFAGEFKDRQGNIIYDAKVHPVIISGMGVVFDTSIDNHKKFLRAIEECPALFPLFHQSSSQMFKVVDDEADAEKYLKEMEEADMLEDYIKGLSGGRLKAFGRIFNLTGSDAVIKVGLHKMAKGTKQVRQQLAKVINNPDKAIVELIYAAMVDGDAANRKGMYKNGSGLYFYNDLPLGMGEEATIAFLKHPDQAELYQALKDAHLSSLKAESKE